MRLAPREVYQTPVGLVTAELHLALPDQTRGRIYQTIVGKKYIYRADICDRTIEGWGPTQEKAKAKFERTLEKWLSDGAP